MPDAVAAATSGATPLRYRVSGMDCPSCAGKIETALRRLDGTDDIRINFHTQVLTVRLDEAATSRDRVEASIRQLGFGVASADLRAVAPDAVSEGSASEAVPAWQAWLRLPKTRLAAAIGLLLVAGFAVTWVQPGIGHWAYLPAALLGLAFFGRRAMTLARAGSPFSIEMLMSIAALGAILIGATTEAAAVVFLFSIGELLEGVAAGRARAGIHALESLLPRTALLVADGAARPVRTGSLQPGDLLLIRPGDRVPADGTIADGESELDEGPITGESI
ncbi:MAG TPA: cation transporter, partial [Acetobacteraceae bacterium]|nr:cation transporter [Acetobacteraceae bacterium]